MKKILLILLLYTLSWPSHAAIVIYGTRVIYPAGHKEISVQLNNHSDKTSLIQAWIDNGDPHIPPEEIEVPFLLTPPIATIAAGNGQQLRIRVLPNTLPVDRESVFYLNVLDIPPHNPAQSGNQLKLAMQNRIKLFYRPPGIRSLDEKTVDQVFARRTPKGIQLDNRSAHHITITTLSMGKRKQLLTQTIMLAPFSQQSVADTTAIHAPSVTLTYLDDYGVKRQQDILIN
ncbi:fimbria/pilus periplasmic chaperone [Edwardsiella tarda]|uniref:fimbria/pilus periplasmic chaperone n=1 Tax=Edwardsiella tarda TaxID=636 RepID=UPI00098E886A|nr:fimbria/pilus periplasmic chaperone [Edwardsiella tarda]